MVIDPLARTVLQMMSRFGGDAELIAHGESVYDPETSTVVASEERKQVRVMVFDYLPKTSGVGVGDMLIQAGDKQVFLKPSNDIPAPKARVQNLMLKGTKYNIIMVKEVNPSGTNVLLYELFVRE